MKQTILFATALVVVLATPRITTAQRTVARQWNDVQIEAIRLDFTRPTLHARNLFHVSVAMYDAWAAYDQVAMPYLLGNSIGGFTVPFDGVAIPSDVSAAREEAMSYAAYRLLSHRYQGSPNTDSSQAMFDSVFTSMGYDKLLTSTDYAGGSAAALGNFIAQRLIEFGLQDHANEQNGYVNRYYEPRNPVMRPEIVGNPNLVHPNIWQPLRLEAFVDKTGNPFPSNTQLFDAPEWGEVTPFALTDADLTMNERDGYIYYVYHDPGAPPHIDTLRTGGISEEYKWGFALVATWAGHLDPNDGVLWDISPASMGNAPDYPRTLEEYHSYYNFIEGGDAGEGRALNPYTGQAYEPQLVRRADYIRVLVQLADGFEFETPPAHWYNILNYVGDHPLFEKRLNGVGPILDPLEWDVKAFFAMGSALHDASIATWGVKSWYDYVRPISAIRFMADKGQSTNPNLPRYHPAGIPLVEGHIEMIQPGDPLAGDDGENIGKIKLYAWRGHDYIRDPDTNVAGVDWMLADYWWPYQIPTFVTPPFAGYVSGHSAYSATGAVVMALLTGDEFFPGGLGEWEIPSDNYVIFEHAPSAGFTLQWATYRDASDQLSLSRIWGGIHPPADDIPGRIMGADIGGAAFNLARSYFNVTR